jgi:hypothetical protein
LIDTLEIGMLIFGSIQREPGRKSGVASGNYPHFLTRITAKIRVTDNRFLRTHLVARRKDNRFAAVHESLPGTFRTWFAVGLESVMRFKADVGQMSIAACSQVTLIAGGRWRMRARLREPVSKGGSDRTVRKWKVLISRLVPIRCPGAVRI